MMYLQAAPVIMLLKKQHHKQMLHGTQMLASEPLARIFRKGHQPLKDNADSPSDEMPSKMVGQVASLLLSGDTRQEYSNVQSPAQRSGRRGRRVYEFSGSLRRCRLPSGKAQTDVNSLAGLSR